MLRDYNICYGSGPHHEIMIFLGAKGNLLIVIAPGFTLEPPLFDGLTQQPIQYETLSTHCHVGCQVEF